MIHALPDKAPSIADTVNEVGDTDAVDNMPKLTSDLPTVAGAETEPQQELTNGISDAPAAEEEELETPKTLAKLVSENTLTPPLLSKHRLKLVFVGDGTVGKTSLLNYYQMRQTIQDDKYTPTVFNNINCQTDLVDGKADISLWDTAGQDDYARLRPLSYSNADIFVVCFAVDRMDSYLSVSEQWLPEIKHYAGNVPVILIGLKQDLREQFPDKCVPIEEPMKLRASGKVVDYYEASAKNGYNIDKTIQVATMFAIEEQKKVKNARKKRCSIL